MSPELKFFVSTRLCVGTKKERFHRRSKREDLDEIKVCGLRSVLRFPNGVFYAPRGRDSSYFGPFGCVFFSLRGCLAKILGYGNAARFWPYETSRFWDKFLVGKNREFRLVFFMKIIAASEN